MNLSYSLDAVLDVGRIALPASKRSDSALTGLQVVTTDRGGCCENIPRFSNLFRRPKCGACNGGGKGK